MHCPKESKVLSEKIKLPPSASYHYLSTGDCCPVRYANIVTDAPFCNPFLSNEKKKKSINLPLENTQIQIALTEWGYGHYMWSSVDGYEEARTTSDKGCGMRMDASASSGVLCCHNRMATRNPLWAQPKRPQCLPRVLGRES